MEAAAFADRHGFTAIWTPERHFHEFGGIFPNPSLLGAFLAARTTHVRIRAGSVVLPLHNPIRIAEEWSVVDNLSGGRVDLGFAVGWHPNDFVLEPDRYHERVRLTFDGIDTVRRLWRGGHYVGSNGLGEPTSVNIYPAPIQKELPVWVTCSAHSERFTQAGRGGFNVLTALIFQSLDQLADRIREYRAARESAGHDPETGTVTLMLHTFVGESLAGVRDLVRAPLKAYLRSSVELWKQNNKALNKVGEDALEIAFVRYFTTNGLFGTVESCASRVEDLKKIGVDELACLIDFGVAADVVVPSLEHLNRLRDQCTHLSAPRGHALPSP
jgi:natural product biosynthesis luciferase-like monooxygenase protein